MNASREHHIDMIVSISHLCEIYSIILKQNYITNLSKLDLQQVQPLNAPSNFLTTANHQLTACV